MDVELPKPQGKMAETIEEAARDVAKCLNERNGNGLDLRHVAMLVYHAQQGQSVMKINPADFSVSLVLQNLNSFAPVRTNGVTVTHEPSGLSITETEGRSQHTNRNAAFDKLKILLIEKGYTE